MTFLFDIGKVLVNFNFQLALDRIQRDSGHSIAENHARIEALKTQYETGHIDRAEFLSTLRVLLNYRASDEELAASWQQIFSPNQPMWDFVKKVEPHYPLHHLSNISDLHLDYLRETYPVFAAFKSGTYSWLAGAMKPDPAIYHTAIRDLQLTPEKTIFIDDLGANVDTAKSLGFLAFQYDIHNHAAFLQWAQPFLI